MTSTGPSHPGAGTGCGRTGSRPAKWHLHCAEEGIIGDLLLSGGEHIAEQAVEQQCHGNGNDQDRQDGKSAAVAVAVIIIIISVWSVLRALIRHGIGLLSLLLHHTIFWCFLQFSRQNVL